MRVKFRVGVGMVNSVHNAISPWAEVRRTLRQPGKEKEEFFPGAVHGKSLVGGVAMLKKGLGKQRQVPMKNKKENNENHNKLIEI